VGEPHDWTVRLAELSEGAASLPLRICQLCVGELAIDGAGIAMVTTSGNRGVVCSTDAVSARVEELQFLLGEGPCVDAVASAEPVLVPDLDNPDDLAVDRWPAFMAGATEAGVRAVFAFPLRIGAIRIGALDLYRSCPGELSAGQLGAVLQAADAAALALLHLGTQSGDPFADNLDAGSTYHLQVHQATGMVQVQMDVTTDQALLMLRARAFATDQPLVDVAAGVVNRTVRFSREPQ
jgi:GAF domain